MTPIHKDESATVSSKRGLAVLVRVKEEQSCKVD
jgi:hypothetical protein